VTDGVRDWGDTGEWREFAKRAKGEAEPPKREVAPVKRRVRLYRHRVRRGGTWLEKFKSQAGTR
jgi:hypothetical protein